MTDVFLSYSSKDRERVRPVRDALAAAGYSVFWDVETPAGENWDQWIRHHLTAARVVVVCWTPNSAASRNVQHEAVVALEDGKLLPVLLQAMKASEFPMGFYTTQAAMLADWRGEAGHKGYLNLMAAVRTRLSSGAVAAEAAARQDEAADIADLRRRANAGEASAQTQLGYRYDIGQGVAKDEREAARLYRLAADQGYPGGQCNLGRMYSNGRGVAKDEREAVRLYRLAADRGHTGAQYHLGFMYVRGAGGLSIDTGEADRLWKLAAAAGNVAAQAFLKGQGIRW